MATTKIMSRLCSRLQPLALKFGSKNSVSSSPQRLKSSVSPSQTSARRVSRVSRLPVELSSLDTMLPLHSANASARLKSSLSLESHCWGLVPQGISMPL